MSKEILAEESPITAVAEPHIDLASESTIKTVAALYETIKHSLDAHDAIEINAADVTTIDTATLQLLVSLKKDAPNLGKTVDIIYPSERFVESAKLLGLLDVLEVAKH
jgi:ABC-type transporter Mla MlaB component